MLNKRNGSEKWILIFGAIALISLMFVIVTNISNRNKLQVYTTPETIPDVEVTQENALDDVKMTSYSNDEKGYSIGVPDTWVKVIKSGFTTYVDQDTGASVQIQDLEYDPTFNNMTEETAYQMATNNGYTFVSFNRTGNASYEILYQGTTNATYDYVESVYWDRDSAVRVLCSLSDEQYQKDFPVISAITNSFTWERPNPIPEGFNLAYFDAYGIEVGIPETWTTSVSDNSYVAMDEASSATMTLQAQEFDGTVDSLSEMDISNMVSATREGYIMNDFRTLEGAVYCSGIYTVNNVQYINDVMFISNGSHLFVITFDYENGSIDANIPNTCFELARVLYTTQAEENIEQAE